jgi:hypothetical protein
VKILAVIGATFVVAAHGMAQLAPARDGALPPTLAATGFDRAAKSTFTPNHSLWSDGATKRRWIALPPGTAIDKSDPDAWDFPRGTKLWKEFSMGRAVETRFIERLADGSWRYATYVWNADGTAATLAPEGGALLDLPDAPGGKYVVPSRADCLACHEGPAVPILGFSAFQLEAKRAPGDDASHALGYLHANCGHCHNANALGGVGLQLAQSARDPQAAARQAIDSIDTERAHEMLRRIGSDNPYVRMPPLGVRVRDRDGLEPVSRWIRNRFIEAKEKPQ